MSLRRASPLFFFLDEIIPRTQRIVSIVAVVVGFSRTGLCLLPSALGSLPAFKWPAADVMVIRLSPVILPLPGGWVVRWAVGWVVRWVGGTVVAVMVNTIKPSNVHPARLRSTKQTSQPKTTKQCHHCRLCMRSPHPYARPPAHSPPHKKRSLCPSLLGGLAVGVPGEIYGILDLGLISTSCLVVLGSYRPTNVMYHAHR